LQFNQSAKNTA